MNSVTVDFVARGEDPQTWKLVLVEQGPWSEAEIQAQLRRVQERLYNCLDAALDGQVATRFPESLGGQITIRLDGYGLPEEEVRSFFEAFAKQVLQLPDYASALASTQNVGGIDFELSLEDLPHTPNGVF